MARKTRRRGAGKKAETRHSPLARKLMIHRTYEKIAVPDLQREIVNAEALQAQLTRQAADMTTPEGRAEIRRIQEEHAREILATTRATLDQAKKAKASLRKEFQSAGGTRRRKRRHG